MSLTSKLFWQQGYHQVQLLNGIHREQGHLRDCLIHFGEGQDARFAGMVKSMILENGVGILDRGFASWEFLDELSMNQTRFVVGIKNNMKTEFDHQRYGVVWFCELESRSEFWLARDLHQLTNAEIGEIYRDGRLRFCESS